MFHCSAQSLTRCSAHSWRSWHAYHYQHQIASTKVSCTIQGLTMGCMQFRDTHMHVFSWSCLLQLISYCSQQRLTQKLSSSVARWYSEVFAKAAQHGHSSDELSCWSLQEIIQVCGTSCRQCVGPECMFPVQVASLAIATDFIQVRVQNVMVTRHCGRHMSPSHFAVSDAIA